MERKIIFNDILYLGFPNLVEVYINSKAKMKRKLIDIFKSIIDSKKVIFYTGAEISSDAGISSLRTPTEIFSYYDTNELSSLEGFEKDPQLVWDWYQNRRKSVATYGVTESYEIITNLQRLLNNAKIITQNVDCQHRIAGSKNIVELRGNFFQCKCNNCKRPFLKYDIEVKTIPRCVHCDGFIRPDVVWFNEHIDYTIIQQANEDIMNADLLIMVGLYNDMHPSKEFFELAKTTGTTIIEFSKADTIFTENVDYSFRGSYKEMLASFLSDYIYIKEKMFN